VVAKPLGERFVISPAAELEQSPITTSIMKRKILLPSLLSFLQFVLVHFLLIQRFANSGDEQAYLYEAKLFSHGQLYAEDPFLFPAVVEVYRLTREQRIGKWGWRAAMASLIVYSFIYGDGQTRDIYKRLDLERTVATVPEKKKVILLESGTYKMEIPDLIRNPPDLWSADTLYFAYGDGVGIADLLKRFPGHNVYPYHYPGSLRPRTE
jgi:hypothetical protein